LHNNELDTGQKDIEEECGFLYLIKEEDVQNHEKYDRDNEFEFEKAIQIFLWCVYISNIFH